MATKAEKKLKLRGAPKLTTGDYPYVSLMPPSRQKAIENSEAKTKWIRIVGAGAALAVVLALGAVGFKFSTQLAFDGAKSDAAAVEQSILKFKEIDNAFTIQQEIEREIVQVTGGSVVWQELYTRIRNNLPAGSFITSFSVVTGGTEADEETVSVLVNVSSKAPIAYSQILDSFGKVPGLVGDSLLIGNLIGGETYDYPVAFTMDTTVLSQQFSYLTNSEAEPVEPPKPLQEEQAPTLDPTEDLEETNN